MKKIRNSDDFADAMELDTIIRIVNSSSLEKFSDYYQTLESSEVNLDYTNKPGDEDKETNSIIDVSQEKQLDQENQPLTIDFHDLISLSSETFSCREDLIGSARAIVLRHGYATTMK
ncbi:hypothetical protein ACH5RR_017805 [Cinchona calisaya]|uniref:Uncharacterized protein n=1 Tax=Cinchona calisaya TaxID=153742 RepID=A0ABD2ZLD7_9GENT